MNDSRPLFSPRLYSQESHINIKREDKAETKGNSNQSLHDSSFTNALVVIIYNTFLEINKILDNHLITPFCSSCGAGRSTYIEVFISI